MSTPAAYCTDDAVRSVLVDPALDCLMGLAGGLFPASEVSAACSVLREHCRCEGLSCGKDVRRPAWHRQRNTVAACDPARPG